MPKEEILKTKPLFYLTLYLVFSKKRNYAPKLAKRHG